MFGVGRRFEFTMSFGFNPVFLHQAIDPVSATGNDFFDIIENLIEPIYTTILLVNLFNDLQNEHIILGPLAQLAD